MKRMRSRATSELSDTDGTALDRDEDGGDVSLEKGGKKPISERRCLVTREVKSSATMIRFVVGPGQQVFPDVAGRLPGRGMWLSARRDVIDSPRIRQAFARAAKAQVVVPEGLADLVEAGLVRRMADVVSLARRAGQAVCGFQKCREWLISGKAALVVRSQTGSPDECARLMSGRRDIPMVVVPDRILTSAFGRERAVYVVLTQGALAQRLITEHERFSGVAGLLPPGPDGGSEEQAEL
ncbi:RNA-binding protein [Neokomagataea thailandica]|uniref:RNA-binding protein n=1 Tax=Neokomagataea TaxID=1223423 RepID=UPI001FDF0BEE|nr:MULTISPECIES: RNA-binding protein [Neokomagataea]